MKQRRTHALTDADADTDVHSHTQHTQRAVDLGSITEAERHTLVWVQCLTQCLQPLGLHRSHKRHTQTQAHNKHTGLLHTQTHSNKSMPKCHVTVFTEHEELDETELSNAGLQWLTILMKSAVSELADVLFLPLFNST